MSDDNDDDILSMSISTLEARAAQASSLIAQADSLLPGQLEIPENIRRNLNGYYREGEAQALGCLVDLAEKRPELFSALAAKDMGEDPKVFEAKPLRDHLQRILVIGQVLAALEELRRPLSGTQLHLGHQTKPLLQAMYEIVKPLVKHDPMIASTCKPALDFYGAIGQAAAMTKKKKKGDEKPEM